MKSLYTHSLKCALAFGLLFSSANVHAQTLGIYEFNGTGACPQNNTHVTAQPTNAVFSTYSSVNTTCTASNDVFNNKAWNAGANIDLSEYNELSIIPHNCHRLNLVSLGFEHKLSTGTADWHVRSNLDNFMADFFAGSSTAVQSTAFINLPSEFLNVDTLIIRFYITGISIGTTTWRQDNVTVSGTVNAILPFDHYIDSDGDGFGAGNAVPLCSTPAGYALNNTDCDDTNPNIHPNSLWHADADNDGFGDPGNTETGCSSTLENATLAGNDCDDGNALIHQATVWYEDADLDGFGDALQTETGCISSFAHPVLVSGDCNDAEPNVYPGAPEICDAYDNDCNGQVNDGLAFSTYYVDADNDGFGTGNAQSFCDNPGNGHALVNGDCDDGEPSIHPGATEILGNGIDENCDGTDGYLTINELDVDKLSIFPNPGNESITLDLGTLLETVTIGIFTASGVLVKTLKTTPSPDFQMDMRQLENGIYLLEIESHARKAVLRWLKHGQ